MNQFIYTENSTEYEDVLNRKIKDCLCKHVMSLKSEKSKEVFKLSQQINYQYVQWGFASKLTSNYEKNREYNLLKINKMINSHLNNAVRIIIDKEGDIWIDNLHSAIRNTFLKNTEICIGDMKIYIIDFSKNRYMPTIVNVNKSLSNKLQDILGAVQVSFDRLDRISKDIKDIHYTIGEFIEENNLVYEELLKNKDK